MALYTCRPMAYRVFDSSLVVDVKADDPDDAAIAYARHVLPRMAGAKELEVELATLLGGRTVKLRKVVHVLG